MKHVALLLVLALPLAAGDWSNNGGNAARNGLSDEVGPIAADFLWTGGRPSIIAWQPMVAGRRVFVVRQTGFPPSGEPNGSPLVCMDLDTGAELWTVNVPFATGDWTTFCLGTSNGQVYGSRSGNGGSVARVFHAYDQATGAFLWSSVDTIDVGFYDGVVFAPNGDLVIGNATNVRRVAALDGSTVWESPRVCNVTSSCGVALFGNAVYVAEPAPGGNVVRRLDLATGAAGYQTPVMSGFTLQNTPFVGNDGTLYLSRTQNNVATDFLFAFEDTGAALVPRWNRAAGWSTTSEWGTAPDGSVFLLAPDLRLEKLDPATGATLATTANPISTAGGPSPHFAVDQSGKVFVSNGDFATGELFAFNPDLSFRWSLSVPNVNQGGPALGEDGTLVVAGIGTNIFALRTTPLVAASATPRNAGANVDVLTSGLPILGCTWSASLPDSTQGHGFAALLVVNGALDVPLASGQHLLVNAVAPAAFLDVQLAGAAEFAAPIPLDMALMGRDFYAQAAYVGGVPFQLTNALDLILGG
ncbi:MAG: PQQ-binding-like beta-propeller repeat protein [Planctomycetota bacterium]